VQGIGQGFSTSFERWPHIKGVENKVGWRPRILPVF
jgi:hypothetical protein